MSNGARMHRGKMTPRFGGYHSARDEAKLWAWELPTGPGLPRLLAMILKRLDKKKVHRSLGAIAGFTSALSVMVGTLAARATPKGWGRVSMALHFTKKPLIMKLAPILTGASVAVVTAVGIMGFWIWLMERESDAGQNSQTKSPSP
jgi:hypothetical protein